MTNEKDLWNKKKKKMKYFVYVLTNNPVTGRNIFFYTTSPFCMAFHSLTQLLLLTFHQNCTAIASQSNQNTSLLFSNLLVTTFQMHWYSSCFITCSHRDHLLHTLFHPPWQSPLAVVHDMTLHFQLQIHVCYIYKCTVLHFTRDWGDMKQWEEGEKGKWKPVVFIIRNILKLWIHACAIGLVAVG